MMLGTESIYGDVLLTPTHISSFFFLAQLRAVFYVLHTAIIESESAQMQGFVFVMNVKFFFSFELSFMCCTLQS
jgi:hypothetical protein